MSSLNSARIAQILFALSIIIGLALSSSANSKQMQEPLPPVIWDMDDIKPPSVIEPDPGGMPVVASTGTPSMSREEAVEIKSLIDQEDLINTASSNGQGVEDDTLLDDFGGVSLMSAAYNPTYDSCTGTSKILCAYDDVYRFYYVDFIPSAGATAFVATTTDLQRLHVDDTNTPDTMLYLLKCNDDYCASGDVVAIDDNDNTDAPDTSDYDSKISATLIADVHYRIVMVDKYQGAEGTADLGLKFGTYNPAIFNNVAAGGWHIRYKGVKAGDSLFVGKNSNSSTAGFVDNREYHDSLLLYLTSSSVNCNSSCGKFLFNDDYVIGTSPMFLSKIDVPTGYQNATGGGRIIVGVVDSKNTAGNWFKMNARFLHYRRSTTDAGQWSGSANYNDNDGDGLSWELENLLGSCDLISDTPADGVGIQGMSCQQFAQRVGTNDWSPTDSDNDGINDDAEVFSVAVHCTQIPSAPYYNPGVCTRFGLHEGTTCPSGTYCVGTDVSAMSDPNPNIYDVYIFNDYISLGTTEYRVTDSNVNGDGGQDLLRRTWHDYSLSCWGGSAAYLVNGEYRCTGDDDLPYMFNVHVYSVEGTKLPPTEHHFADASSGYECPSGRPWTNAFFNMSFKPELKYAGIGLYSLSVPNGGGQSGVGERNFLWGASYVDSTGPHGDSDAVSVMSHEAGHCLGIPDIMSTLRATECENAEECPDVICPEVDGRDMAYAEAQNPAYPSLMNYGFSSHGAGMREKNTTIPTYDDGIQQGCFKSYLRFSKGLWGTLNEQALIERNPISNDAVMSWSDYMAVRDLECYYDVGRARNPYNGYCTVSACFIDWDADRFTTIDGPGDGPYSFDLSYGKVNGDEYPTEYHECSMDLLADVNDLGTIQSVGKVPLQTDMYFDRFIMYRATYNGQANENLAGWDIDTTEQNMTYASGIYPINGCYNDSDCGGRYCRFDTCIQNSDCRNGRSCGSSGVCQCVGPVDCMSSACVGGSCVASRGSCACSIDADCSEPSEGTCLPQGYCTNRFRAADTWSQPNYHAPKYAATFNAISGSSILFEHTGTSSPFVAINDLNSIEVKFDLYWKGMNEGQSLQRILTSGNLNISIMKTTSGGLLFASFSGSPGKTIYLPILTHQWYRVWVYSDKAASGSTHPVNVVISPWDNYMGLYSYETDDVMCVSSTRSGNFTYQTEVVLGNVSAGTYPFSGYLDNVHIRNFTVSNQRPECP